MSYRSRPFAGMPRNTRPPDHPVAVTTTNHRREISTTEVFPADIAADICRNDPPPHITRTAGYESPLNVRGRGINRD